MLIQTRPWDSKNWTLLNLGQAFSMADEHWPMCCQLVEAKLKKRLHPLFKEMPIQVKEQVQRMVVQLQAKGYKIGHIMDDQEKGLVDETQVPKTRTVGAKEWL